VTPSELFRRLSVMPGIDEFAGQDERGVTLRFAGGSSAQVLVTAPVNAGAMLVTATGSDGHLRELADHAAARGSSLRGAALWQGSRFIPTPDEAALYGALGLPWIPPELREGRGEVALAAAGALPRLIERSDLAGFLHCHTRYSDGSNTVREIALACRDAGYAYVGITDHSAAAAYAGGLSPGDLERQADEIDAVNAEMEGIRVLKGVEADILQDGRVDYDEAVLARLDFVIASVHSRFNMGRDEMTRRMLAAMDNPHLTIIGHPTGRLLLARDPYPLDLDAVIAKAAATGVALEMNADPHRLDLDWRHAAAARAAGAMISIGADAHNVAGLENVDAGLAMARKAGLGPADILNARPVDDFLSFARRAAHGQAR
jgi:DNA polymerase (family 10)